MVWNNDTEITNEGLIIRHIHPKTVEDNTAKIKMGDVIVYFDRSSKRFKQVLKDLLSNSDSSIDTAVNNAINGK